MERSNHIVRILSLIVFVFAANSSFSQEEKFLVNKGNDAYNKGDYIQAKELYDEAREIDPNLDLIEYNTADVLYQEKKYAEAIEKYKTLSETLENKELRAKAYHNLGNSYLETQQYDKSVQAFKNSLKLNPNDEETRYNLAYAMEKLREQQQQQQQQQNQNQDQNQDQNKDQNKDQNQDQNKDQNKDQNQDQNKDQDQGDQKDQKDQQKPQPNQMSKEDAERMLNALNQDEKKIQKKMKKKKGKGANEKIEKDW